MLPRTARSEDLHALGVYLASSTSIFAFRPARCLEGLALCICFGASAPTFGPSASRTRAWRERQARMLLWVSCEDACEHHACFPGHTRSFYYRTFFRSKNRLRYHSCHPATVMHTSNEKTLNHATLEFVASLRSLISASLFFMSSI